MASLVTDTNLIQRSVGLEIMMLQKLLGMKRMKCVLLPGTDFVKVRKNWIDVVTLVASMTRN